MAYCKSLENRKPVRSSTFAFAAKDFLASSYAIHRMDLRGLQDIYCRADTSSYEFHISEPTLKTIRRMWSAPPCSGALYAVCLCCKLFEAESVSLLVKSRI